MEKQDDLFADELAVVQEDSAEHKRTQNLLWKVLIVDDDDEVHNITKIVLSEFTFDGRGIQFLSAYSGQEARQVIMQNPDTAVILLDVVMETPDSGLRVASYIREELKNNFVRIILRTGQPGSAPEEKVIREYDINDYKEKTELTYGKLYTTITTALRSYRDIMIIDTNRQGLHKVIEASASIFRLQSMRVFANGVLDQMIALMNYRNDAFCCKVSSFASELREDEFFIFSGTGRYSDCVNQSSNGIFCEKILERLNETLRSKTSQFYSDCFVGYFQSKAGTEMLLYIDELKELSETDRDLVDLFCSNIAIAFDNVYLQQEIEETQREIVVKLGEVVEARSHETGYHIQRVAKYCEILAARYGLTEEEVKIVTLGSSMHDIGKIAIRDSILQNPGRLSNEEREIMNTHVGIGYELLRTSSRTILKAAAIIALQHHEKYNGTGYPRGLKGDDIHIYARIASLADVFDALLSDRVYRKAWDVEKVVQYIKDERGESFDPKLVDILMDNLDEFLHIQLDKSKK